MYEILTSLTADKAEEFTYGYFANNIKDLKTALLEKRSSLRVIYCRLENVLGEEFERRFLTSCGTFSLFCPLDRCAEEKRY